MHCSACSSFRTFTRKLANPKAMSVTKQENGSQQMSIDDVASLLLSQFSVDELEALIQPETSGYTGQPAAAKSVAHPKLVQQILKLAAQTNALPV